MSIKVLQRRPDLKDFEVFKQAEARETTQKILESRISWRDFFDSKILSEKDVGMMQDYDKQSPQDQKNILEEQGDDYASLFIKCLTGISQEKVVQYLLVLLDQMLEVDRSRARFFASLIGKQNPYEPFLRLITRASNPFTVAKATHILSVLLSYGDAAERSPKELTEFSNWLIGRIDSSKGAEILHIAQAIKNVLRSTEAHTVFARQGGLKALTLVLSKQTQNTQLLYLAGFSLWLLSFNKSLSDMLLEHRVALTLCDVLKSVVREKVVRIMCATLKNLLNVPGFNEQMIAGGLLRVIPNLSGRKWNDAELVNDLTAIGDCLENYVLLLSSYEKYKAEIESAKLEWSPVHNEKFWRENSNKFEDENFKLIKLLVQCLDSSDELTLEVACYDLGEFARFHPLGRKFLSSQNGKSKLMRMMTHSKTAVAKQALLAVQKLMVHNWESLTKTVGSAAPGNPSNKQ